MRTFYVADEPSAWIVRVGALSLRRRANFLGGRRTLCGDRACSLSLRSLWRRANLLAGRRTLCGDRACRIALAVVFVKIKYKSSTRSALPHLQPENGKF